MKDTLSKTHFNRNLKSAFVSKFDSGSIGTVSITISNTNMYRVLNTLYYCGMLGK